MTKLNAFIPTLKTIWKLDVPGDKIVSLLLFVYEEGERRGCKEELKVSHSCSHSMYFEKIKKELCEDAHWHSSGWS